MTTTALIAGGMSGIGRAVACKLADLGIQVLITGRNENRGEETIAGLRTAGGQTDFISSDRRDDSSTHEVARRAIDLGNSHVDILINNADASLISWVSQPKGANSRHLPPIRSSALWGQLPPIPLTKSREFELLEQSAAYEKRQNFSSARYADYAEPSHG